MHRIGLASLHWIWLFFWTASTGYQLMSSFSSTGISQPFSSGLLSIPSSLYWWVPWPKCRILYLLNFMGFRWPQESSCFFHTAPRRAQSSVSAHRAVHISHQRSDWRGSGCLCSYVSSQVNLLDGERKKPKKVVDWGSANISLESLLVRKEELWAEPTRLHW